MIELISQPWPWYISGPAISIVMFLLLYLGQGFGVSANLRTLCAIGGGGKFSNFFNFDWKAQYWNLIFVVGAISGGFIASYFLTSNHPVQLSTAVLTELEHYGVVNAGTQFLPDELFSFEALLTVRGGIMMVLGGFLVGFGARYAGGCTSGHAISGLSNLQLPSLIAVIGFFIGGLMMTYFILPYLLQLQI